MSKWKFPIQGECSGIPLKGHLGAFLAKRKYNLHGGIDLYVKDGEPVYSVEAGKIVDTDQFTGKAIGSDWWNDTWYCLIEEETGVVCYGEIKLSKELKLGDHVSQGQFLGNVVKVLPEGKERPDIEGHSCSMLHIELYNHGRHTPSDGPDDVKILRDPTPFLLEASGCPKKMLHGKDYNG